MKKPILFILCPLLCILLIWGIIAALKPFSQESVIIGIIDTGISETIISPDHLLEGKNYYDPQRSTNDTYGHGTAVASVILKHAPEAKLVPLISNVYFEGKIEHVDNDVFAQMIKDAVDIYHCDIINLSMGLILDKPAVREAVEYAEEKGVLLIASAGNDYASDGQFKYYPAGYDSVLAVGSVNKDGSELSDFTQRGKWVNIYACGEKIEVATLNGDTHISDGTSFSAAYVTARAAELLQKNKDLSPKELREELLKAAFPLWEDILVLK